MKKKTLTRMVRTSALVVAAFAITAFLSNDAQAQCYGGSGFGIGVGGFGGYGYGSGLRISYSSFRPVYGYSVYRPYYSNRHYGYGFKTHHRPVYRSRYPYHHHHHHGRRW